MKKFFIGFIVFSSLSLSASPSDAYEKLKELLPFNDHSFYLNASQMQNLLQERQPKVVIELGSWLGSSARHIAQLLPEEGIVYAVDHWLGSVEHHTPKFLDYLPSLYDQFLSNVIHAGLTHKIVPIRMHTLEAVKMFCDEGIQPDLIYVDASHDEDSVYKDLQAYFSFKRTWNSLWR